MTSIDELKQSFNKNLATILMHSPKGVELVVEDCGGQERFREVSEPVLEPILITYDFTSSPEENVNGVEGKEVLNIVIAPKLDIVAEGKDKGSFPNEYLVLPISYNKEKPYNIPEAALVVLCSAGFYSASVDRKGTIEEIHGLRISFVGKGASGKTTTAENLKHLIEVGEPCYTKNLPITTLNTFLVNVSYEGILVLQKYILGSDDAIYLSKGDDWYGIKKEDNALVVYDKNGNKYSYEIVKDLIKQGHSFNMVDAVLSKLVKTREEYNNVLNEFKELYPN